MKTTNISKVENSYHFNIKCSNRFYELQTGKFGVNDWRIFFTILYFSQSKMTDDYAIVIPMNDFKQVLQWKKSQKLFLETFDKSFEKIAKLQTTKKDEEIQEYEYLQLFSKVAINHKEIKIFLNQAFANFFFKELSENFTMLSIEAILQIGDSKSTINLLFRLQRFIDTGKWRIGFSDFKSIFGFENIKDSDIIKKFLDPSVEKLKTTLPDFYKNLRYEFEQNPINKKRSLLVFYYQNPIIYQDISENNE